MKIPWHNIWRAVIIKPNAKIHSDSGNRALGGIIPKFKKNPNLGNHPFSKLWGSCVCPVICYIASICYYAFKDIDSLQYKAHRTLLGVQKFAPLFWLEGEMGWICNKYRGWFEMIHYWNRLTLIPEYRLWKRICVYDCSKCIQGAPNWCNKVKNILELLGQGNEFEVRQLRDIASGRITLFKSRRIVTVVFYQINLNYFFTLYSKIRYMSEIMSVITLRLERTIMAQFRSAILSLEVETASNWWIQHQTGT